MTDYVGKENLRDVSKSKANNQVSMRDNGRESSTGKQYFLRIEYVRNKLSK